MKIEYIPDGAEDCPLIIIYGHDPEAVSRFRVACLGLSEGRASSVAIDKIDGFYPVDDLRLTAQVSKQCHGVSRLESRNAFRWELTDTRWSNVGGLLEPFCTLDERRNAYQWLDETSDISVIISTDRAW